MPFKSQAQRRKFAEMLVNGEISAETFEEWNRETGSAELPERVQTAKKSGTKKKGTRGKKTGAKKRSSAKSRKSSNTTRKSAKKR